MDSNQHKIAPLGARRGQFYHRNIKESDANKTGFIPARIAGKAVPSGEFFCYNSMEPPGPTPLPA